MVVFLPLNPWNRHGYSSWIAGGSLMWKTQDELWYIALKAVQNTASNRLREKSEANYAIIRYTLRNKGLTQTYGCFQKAWWMKIMSDQCMIIISVCILNNSILRITLHYCLTRNSATLLLFPKPLLIQLFMCCLWKVWLILLGLINSVNWHSAGTLLSNTSISAKSWMFEVEGITTEFTPPHW